MQHICDETYKLSTNDLQKYIGVLVLMSIVIFQTLENIGDNTWAIKLSKTQ